MAGLSLETYLQALRSIESGGNYSSRSKSSTASGAYQYIDSTWNNYGGYAHAWQAPKAVQDARALRDAKNAYAKWGDWRKVAAAHFAGGGWVAAHPDLATWNVNPAPGSANPTVASYVQRLFGAAGVKMPSSPSTWSAMTATPQTPTASSGSIRDQVESKYGYLAAYLNDKEIGPIITKAAQEGWDEARLRGALYTTKWWQTHSNTYRQFQAESKMDPATQKAKIAQQVTDLSTMARNLGLVVDPKRLAHMAWQSLAYGWDAQQLRNAMVAEGKFDLSGKQGSAALTLRDDLKARASQYLVPVGDSTLMQWVKNVTKGDVQEQDFDGYLKEQAKSLFPGLAAAIDRGVTVEQYADPYRQLAAQTLELDPQQVNFMDPKYMKALNQIDPKTGDRVSMSLDQWQTTLRTDAAYGYDKTSGAKQAASDLTTQLAKTFGVVG